jgi:hypothetical protein
MTEKKEKRETGLAVPVREGALLPELQNIFNLDDNMAEVEARLPAIGIIHQGQLFRWPFPLPNGKDTLLEFKAVILDMNRINAWWEVSFDKSGGGTPPQCFSMDGITSDPNCEARQHNTCHDCPMNVYKSDPDGGAGKACKNMKRVHLMVEGSLLPYRMTIPPSNLRAVDLYVSMLTSQGVPYQLVKTQFALKAAKNKSGIVYSEVDLTVASRIEDREEALRIKSLCVQYQRIMRGQAIVPTEFDSSKESPAPAPAV